MRVLAVVLALAAAGQPFAAAERVTVEQLERILAKSQDRPDAEVSKQIMSLDLSERLSSARLTQLKADLPGEKSRQALAVLADYSAFLEPPATEIPATATPSPAAQRRMMALTVAYLGKSLPLLPNLFATRDTMRYENKPSLSSGAAQPDNALRPVGRSAVTVFYRDSREYTDAGPRIDSKPRPPDKGLTSWGEFGSIQGTVLIDAARSNLGWSHWELGAGGPQAVFRYTVPREKSHYDVRFCCIVQSYGLETSVVSERAGYHGEITIDPANGAILRLTVEADVEGAGPISRASMAVEYSAVEIGARAYICPVHSIALATAPDLKALKSETQKQGAGNGLPAIEKTNASLPPIKKASVTIPTDGPRQTLLNDVTFRQYHLFRAEARVVPEKEKEEAERASAAPVAPAAVAGGVASGEAAQPSAETAAPVETAVAAAPPEATPAPAADVPEPVIPEISVAGATGLPKEPPARPATKENGFTLRITTRLVDVGVVALDKKGRPIPNLKPEDFEIYDNGVKQDVRSFGQAGFGQGNEPAPQAQTAPAEATFSNHKLNLAKPDSEENTIVLLMDGSNLAFTDLANAREQAVRFIKALPGSERVALYALKKYGFQVLEESSTDHDATAARLAKWMPSAQDLSEAGFNEARNRQQIETVHSPEDLLNVNGNFSLDPAAQSESLDPKLRPLGSDPPRSALDLLVEVARHLAPVSGHKSLVWVTSDNALADWNQAGVSIEKTSKNIEPAALRVQEAMNNAHVSVYPLDASHLEANVITADVGRRNVELTPTFQAPPGVEAAREGPEMDAGPDINIFGQGRDMRPGRLTAQMQQDMHPIQGVFREIAAATGGQTLRRSNNIVGQLNGVVADGRATYLLGFSPSEQADGKYHLLTVKLVNRKDAALRYRTGFQYDQEPAAMKDRFLKTVWQPMDVSDVALSATPERADSTMLELNIAAADLGVAQEGDLWTDKLDVFLVQRDDAGLHALITGQTMSLRLKSETYQKMLREGIPFEQVVEKKQGTGSVRIVVVDENSGRIGSLTLPAAVVGAKR
jgi:VWFA-related protein